MTTEPDRPFGADTAELVSAYAAQFNPTLLDRHAVSSPLGMWLLLAMAGPVTEGVNRRSLEAVLGTTVEGAAARAQELLTEPHPAISALAAVWGSNLRPTFDTWAETLPVGVERGPIPEQAQADAWAQRRTNGLIAEFPLELNDLTRLVLASALATDIGWKVPLGITEALGGEFGAAVRRGLTFQGGIQLIAETEAAGLVAVAAPPASPAIDVLSVIAAPDVAPRDVDRAAHQIAALLRGDDRAARRVPAEELADGHAWSVTERRETRSGGPQVQTEWCSYLPEWSVTSTHDLEEVPGVPALVDALTRFVLEEELPVDAKAKQAAVASFTRSGFKAAALTAIGLSPTGMPSLAEVLVRRIELRFNHPYAVIACAAIDDGPPAWRGMPVFSAWVAEPWEVPADNKTSAPRPVSAS